MRDAQNLMEVLGDLQYDTDVIEERLTQQIADSTLMQEQEKEKMLEKLTLHLSENSYLKTIQAIMAPKEKG